MAYQEKRKRKYIPSASYTTNDLIKLIKLCSDLHAECKTQFRNDISQEKWHVLNLPHDNDAEIDKHLKNFELSIAVYATNGESIHIGPDEFNENHLFPQINKVTISNLSRYEHTFKASPSAYFTLHLSFEQWHPFNLHTNPSHEGANSTIDTFAIKGIFCDGLESQIIDFFRVHRNLNSIVHRQNIFDLLLWLVFFPSTMTIAIKKNLEISNSILKSNFLLQTLISLVLFFFLISIFRLIFNLGRWLFPYQEINNEISLPKKITKFVYSSVFLTLFGGAILHLATELWKIIEK